MCVQVPSQGGIREAEGGVRTAVPGRRGVNFLEVRKLARITGNLMGNGKFFSVMKVLILSRDGQLLSTSLW